MIKVKSGATTIAEFRYDGLNRQTVKYDGPASSPTATYDYYYNEDWQVLDVREDGVANPIEQFIWHPYYIDALAVRFYDANTLDTTQADHYYQQDANFNVVAVTNSSGAVQERYNYSAYGDVTILDPNFDEDSGQVSDIANGILYTGREWDSETGIYYYRNRYYDGQIGRFVNRDPIAYEGSEWNLYEYASCRPQHKVDPTGFLAQVPILVKVCSLGGRFNPFTGAVITGGTIGYTVANEPYLVKPYYTDPVTDYLADIWTDDGPNECPPCPKPPPAVTHYDHDHGGCFKRTGSKTHWHWFRYNQNPKTCKCYLQRMYGGCGVAPSP